MVDSVNLSTESGTSSAAPNQPMMGENGQLLEPGAENGNQDAGNAGTDARPGWLPEKFQSPEDLAKAYTELSQKLGSQSTEQSSEATEAPTTEGEAQAAVEKAGLDFNAVNREFQASGELSADTYQKLADGGIPKDTVDAYIAGQEALATAAAQEVFQLAGGEEQYNKLADWAARNWTDAQIEQYDSVINSGNELAIQSTIASLKSAYTAAMGADPSLVGGQTGMTSAVGYRSQAEMMADMSNPKYRNDPAFRADVERKLAATTAF